jgi:hypothetical protein
MKILISDRLRELIVSIKAAKLISKIVSQQLILLYNPLKISYCDRLKAGTLWTALLAI